VKNTSMSGERRFGVGQHQPRPIEQALLRAFAVVRTLRVRRSGAAIQTDVGERAANDRHAAIRTCRHSVIRPPRDQEFDFGVASFESLCRDWLRVAAYRTAAA